MIEFLNYVPPEGSIGELLCKCMAAMAVACCVVIIVHGILWTLRKVKKIAEDD